MRGGPPYVMAVRAVQHARAVPLFSVDGPDAEAKMIVDVPFLGTIGVYPPGPGVHEEFAVKDEKVRVANVAVGDVEGVYRLPFVAVVTRHNDDARRGKEHVAVGAASVSQIEAITKTAQVGKGVVQAVIDQLTYRVNSDRGHGGGSRGRAQAESGDCDRLFGQSVSEL